MGNFLVFSTVLFAISSGLAMGWFINNGPQVGCQDVLNNFSFCQAYLFGGYNDVPSQCCSGLVNLNGVAKQEYGGVRRICQCIENIAASTPHPPFSEARIQDLYFKCNIHLSFPISERMDCSRVF